MFRHDLFKELNLLVFKVEALKLLNLNYYEKMSNKKILPQSLVSK